jgi:hypothetical protein
MSSACWRACMRERQQSVTATRRTLAVLSFAGVRIALEQRDLGEIESAAEVQAARDGLGIGCVQSQGRPWPVYALDARLQPVATRDAARRVCAMLVLDDVRFGLLVDDLALLDPKRATAFAVPGAMRLADSPLRALLRVDDGVIAQTSAAALAARAGIDAARIAAALRAEEAVA